MLIVAWFMCGVLRVEGCVHVGVNYMYIEGTDQMLRRIPVCVG